MKRMILAVLALVAMCFLSGASQAVEYKWTGIGFVEVASVAPTAADETAITETELLASTPRRSVTKTTTTTATHLSTASACTPARSTASACSSTASSSRSTIVTRQRQFTPVRRLFGARLRGGC